jgi:hypothetical protein
MSRILSQFEFPLTLENDISVPGYSALYTDKRSYYSEYTTVEIIFTVRATIHKYSHDDYDDDIY